MKKKKLRAKLSSTKKKLVKAEAKLSKLESRLSQTAPAVAKPRKSKATDSPPKKTPVRKPAVAKKTDG